MRRYVDVIVAMITIRNGDRDFPGGPVVKNPPCIAGNVGLIPGQGIKIPHPWSN